MKHQTRFHKPVLCLLFSAALGLMSPVLSAQNEFDLNELGKGQLILNLNVNEQDSVEQDTLNAMLEYSTQGRDATALQNEVNEAIRNALNILKDTKNIEYSTGQYRVNIFQPGRPGRKDVDNPPWRALQRIQMTSQDSEALLAAAGRLQEEGLHMVNLYYSLSREKYEETADSLLHTALSTLQARADDIARTLNKKRADLVEVNVNDNRGFFADAGRRTPMALNAADAITAPSAEPGDAQVNVNVSARALLSP